MCSDEFGVNSGVTRILSDGKWHAQSEFMELMSIIPVEVASQKYQVMARKNKHREVPSLERKVDKGRFFFVHQRLLDLVHEKKAERRAKVTGELEFRAITTEATNAQA